MFFPHPVALIAIGAISAYFAKKWGKNPYLWFLLGMLFGIFGLVLLFFSRPAPKAQKSQAVPKHDPNTIDITPKADQAAKEKFWYYLDPQNNQQGPMSFKALTHTFREGKINAKTFVWNETIENWQPLGDFIN